MAEEERPTIKPVKVDLHDPEFQKTLEGTLSLVAEQEASRDARELARELNRILGLHQDLRQANPKLYETYEKLVVKFRFLAIPHAENFDEIKDLLIKHLLVAFDIPKFNLKKALDRYLILYIFNLELWDYMQAIQKTVETSLLKLGEAPLQTPNGPANPTISRWIGEYNRTMGLDKERDSFQELEFINQNPNAQKLSDQNKGLLKRVLNFYDWLLFPKPQEEEMDYIPPEIEKVLKYVQQNAAKIVHEIVEAQKGPAAKKVEPPVKAPVSVPKPPIAVPTPVLPHGVSLEQFKQRLEPKSVPPLPKTIDVPEIKREVETPELPAHEFRNAELVSASLKRDPESSSGLRYPTKLPTQQPVGVAPKPIMGLKSLDDIHLVDDLKKIEILHLRQSNLSQQIRTIKEKIAYLVAVNKFLPYHAVSAFERSPLFQSYLSIGSLVLGSHEAITRDTYEQTAAKLRSQGKEALSLQEFEAIADLRKEIERM